MEYRIKSLFRAVGAGTALYPILRPYFWMFPVVIVSGVTASALEGLGVGLIIPLLTTLQGSAAAGQIALPGPLAHIMSNVAPHATIAVLCSAIFALILVKALVQMANSIFVAWLDGSIGSIIRATLARHVLRMDYKVFLSEDKARLINIVASESWRTSDVVRHISDIMTAMSAIIVFAVILSIINWHLFALVIFSLLLLRGVQAIITRRLQALSLEVTEANQELSRRMIVVTDAIRPIRMFGRVGAEESRFAQSSDRVRRAIIVIEKVAAAIGPVNEVFYGLLFVGVFLLANALGTQIPVLTAFLVLLYRMQPHVLILSRAWVNLRAARGSINEVEWLLNAPGEPQHGMAKGLENLSAVHPIVFEDVCFSYPVEQSERRALDSVNFDTGISRVIALLGRSGSGKSTIVNLICGLLVPDKGRIFVHSLDLSALDPHEWRQKIGLAGQDIDLVDGTIADNIAYGARSVSMEEIQAAAKLVDADRFIDQLPLKYETEVGSRGEKLSGGQRQRIGLARALIRRPALLVLDEATNSIDGLSEDEIIKVLDNRDYFGTAIVISHRRKTLGACDYGIVMEDGKVTAQGPLNALLYYEEMP